MASFESLEDNFLKKASDPVQTDFEKVQHQRHVQSDSGKPDEDKYENIIKKKDAKLGLAALLDQKIKQSKVDNQKNDESKAEDNTVFLSSSMLRYEDAVAIPQNEVSEDDIQKFYPHEKYNDAFTSPENTIKDGARFEGGNRYGDMLQAFEPKTASADDISGNRSVSSISAPGEPPMNPTDEDVFRHIEEHRQQKNIDNLPPAQSANYEETELSREEHEANLRRIAEERQSDSHEESN